MRKALYRIGVASVEFLVAFLAALCLVVLVASFANVTMHGWMFFGIVAGVHFALLWATPRVAAAA